MPSVRLHDPRTTGLVLTGGGARAAYQVGVLQGIRLILHEAGVGRCPTPFGVITGTSAGAINAAALASRAASFDRAVRSLVGVWSRMHAGQVYRTDTEGLTRTSARWIALLAFGWLKRRRPSERPPSLLDNAPLAELLKHAINIQDMRNAIAKGLLHAVAFSASDYTNGRNVTFYEGTEGIEPWMRSQRLAVREMIGLDHLLASSAIPFVFPPVPLMCEGRTTWFGDGTMRQLAPISPAIHLGAQRVLVIGAGQLDEPERFVPAPQMPNPQDYPSLAQIAGHALSSIFLDSLAMDIERVQRVNATVRLIPPELRAQSTLREVDVLVIAPSSRIDEIAARHVHALPSRVRALLRIIGATEASGAALASYLLFEPEFTRELIKLGQDDTMAQRDDVVKFLLQPQRS